VVYLDRRLKTRGIRHDQVSGRLQVALVALPFLRDGSLAVEGRINRLQEKEPFDRAVTDGAVSVTISQRMPLLH
jgi:hypothetical protein